MQDNLPIHSVIIEAPARLHLGFLDLNGDLGRRFGSIGMAINTPSTILKVSTAPQDHVSGPESGRTLKALKSFKEKLCIKSCYEVRVKNAIPAHAGLGSGTQLALAVGAGLAAINNKPHSIENLGQTLSRGARSAIGISAFENGGFIIDGGKGTSKKPPPLLSRTKFPEEWRVLLVLDPHSTGVHGERENLAFTDLPKMSPEEVGVICRLTLMQLLPGLHEQDISTFGNAITQIQEIVGFHFATKQGGDIWASQHVARIVKRMGELGAQGIGQSSWGPTGFAFTQTQAAAEKLYESVAQDAKGMGMEIIIAHGRNKGAIIKRFETSRSSGIIVSDLKT